MEAATTLEDQVKKTLGYWCKKLTWRWKFQHLVTQKDLEFLCWEKVLRPKVSAKLEEIWRNSDPEHGGVLGISKFLSVLCSNTFRDVHKKLSAKSPEIFGVPLDAPTVINNGDGTTEAGEPLITSLVDEAVNDVPDVFIEDVRPDLTPTEFQVFIEDHLYLGLSIREIEKRRGEGFSKSNVALILASARKKLQAFGERNKKSRGSYLLRLNHQTRYNPARIDPEIRDSWLDTLKSEIVPFYDCPHAEKSEWVGQDFDIGGVPQLGRWALCADCWYWYWRSLCEWLKRTGDDIALEIATDYLALEIATQGLAGPNWTKSLPSTLFMDGEKEKK